MYMFSFDVHIYTYLRLVLWPQIDAILLTSIRSSRMYRDGSLGSDFDCNGEAM